jgi:hypothetical protein
MIDDLESRLLKLGVNESTIHFVSVAVGASVDDYSARPGSAMNSLGLDRRLRLAESTNDQGEAGFCELGKPKKCLTSAASSWKSIL